MSTQYYGPPGTAFPLVVGTPVARTGIVASDGAPINFSPITPPAGTYRINWYLVVTTLFTTSGPLVTFRYTDQSGTAQAVGPAASAVAVGSLCAAGSTINFSQIVQSNGSAQITYQVTSAGTFGACAFYATLERIG